MTDTLDSKQIQRVLSSMNEVAPDTLDGGAYSRWRFTALERDGDTWTLRYTNSGHPDGDFVRFQHKGPCLDGQLVARKWEDAAFEALSDENADEY